MNASTVLLCGWLVVSASPGERPRPLTGEEFQVEGRRAFLIASDQATDQKPKPWVWYAPTLPGLPGDAERWMFERFLGAGIGVAGIDVGESYGSPQGRTWYTALYRELTERRGYSPKPVLLARSRGGLMLYSWACDHADQVGGIAGIYPVCNLLSYPGLERACGAYQLTAAALQDQLAQHNPLDRLAPLAKAGVPLFHIHGDVDVVVPLEKNSGEIQRRYRELGGKMELVVPPGQGHNMWPGFFQCQALVDFVVRQADARRSPK